MSSLFCHDLPSFAHARRHKTENCAARSPQFAISVRGDAASSRWFTACADKNIPNAIALPLGLLYRIFSV